ncbi:Ca-activated chloride channel family protein [Shewanella morhuae]|uniref:VWA domain-containing protein n=1 Tax=Shewanella morhuae TaxID=365591 RepID=UPI00095462FB|nr:VWA domain-containing protein [Shewanella morhuae]SIQ85948.1 Ca-activated chloride channel family protein [Shewanella morhuae]
MSLHFIRPEWLLALVPLALVLLSLWRQHQSHSAWNRYIAPHLAKILVTQGDKKSRRPLHLLAFTWLIATIALAGPAVNKQSLPVFATEQGRVLVMDMSVSMFATDVTPNRLTQAKFRATDLLRNLKEGETGLVAFAGDAFTISPLTRDTGTLLNLLPTLSPEIMPVRGSNLAAALTQAKALLAQGGHIHGDIIVMTDGITATQFDEANSVLSGTQYRLAIMAFGTSQGAPIRLPDGQLQRDNSNEVVVAAVNFGLLQKLVANNKGILIQNRADGNDLDQLQSWLSDAGDAKATELDGETWQDLGPYLALLLLLPALFSFRQGIIAGIGGGFVALLSGLLLAAAPQSAHANIWEDLWQTADQQAMQAYQSQDYANAAKQFESPQWRASAQYKAGDYEQALKTFEQDNSAQGLYNQGNALMQLGKPDKAKERYQAALEKQADFPAAKANLELAEKQLKEQQKQQGNNGQQSKDQDQKEDPQSGQDNDQQNGSEQNKQDQTGQESKELQDTNAEQDPQQSPEQQKADEQSSEQNQQTSNDQSNKDKPQPDSQENQPLDNEANMQAQAKADANNKQMPEQEKQNVSAKDTPKQNDQDKQNIAMDESIEAPPTNSEPLPPEMQRALRGVSEDPQVLLRNKMQLEYQKRRQNGQISKDNEQW